MRFREYENEIKNLKIQLNNALKRVGKTNQGD
jgi:hypothetical protein